MVKQDSAGFIGLLPSQVKVSYSEETKAILDNVFITEQIKRAHELRARAGLKQATDLNLIENALLMYNRRRERFMNHKEKRARKEQSQSEQGARKPEGGGL